MISPIFYFTPKFKLKKKDNKRICCLSNKDLEVNPKMKIT